MNRHEPAAPACFYGQWDAAYVMGALPPDERRSFEGHLATCATCRANVAMLSGMPGLLAAAGPELMDASPEPATVPAYAVFALKVRRRRVRMVGLAAAAVLAVVVGTGAIAVNIGTSGRDGNPARPAAAASAPSPTSEVLRFEMPAGGTAALQATGVLVQQPWGTQIEWTCTYAARPTPGVYASGPTNYEIVLVSSSGAQTVAGSWQARPGDIVSPVAASGLPLQAIAQVVIRETGTSKPILLATP